MTQQPQPQIEVSALSRRRVFFNAHYWIYLVGPLFGIVATGLLIPPLAPSAEAQTVIDGLPPPPSIPDLEPAPTSESPVAPAESTSPAESTPIEVAPANASRYRVLVNSDSPFLLEQVRRIEPAAAFERHQGKSVILAGQFSQLAPAQQQVEALADQGIGAEIAIAPEANDEVGSNQVGSNEAAGSAAGSEVATVPNEGAPAAAVPPPSTESDEFARPGSSIGSGAAALPPADLSAPLTPQTTITDPAVTTPTPTTPAPAEPVPTPAPDPAPVQTAVPQSVAQQPTPSDSDYYIVVPGDADDLDRLQGQVTLLGAHPNAIAQRDRPLGPHLLIGPFVSRQSAAQWNQFLRDFGMDARVYYRR